MLLEMVNRLKRDYGLMAKEKSGCDVLTFIKKIVDFIG